MFLNLSKFKNPIGRRDLKISRGRTTFIALVAIGILISSVADPIINQQRQLTSQNQILTEQNQKLTQENIDLMASKQEIYLDSQETFSRSQSDLSAAEITNEENQKLQTLLSQLSRQQTSLIKSVSDTMQNGLSRPSKVGYAPIFKFTLDKVDPKTQLAAFKRLSQGSYCKKQEVVTFNLDNLKSWKNVGNWRITGYTATVAECDSNPSETASGRLVTPGFTLAVDPKYWDYGTIFYIDSIGFAIADDCGGAIKGQTRGDYLTADNSLSEYINGYHNVWVVYQPTK